MTTCLPCRQKHLRCDKLLPVCTRCKKARTRVKCQYIGLKFRESRFSTNPDPRWEATLDQASDEDHVFVSTDQAVPAETPDLHESPSDVGAIRGSTYSPRIDKLSPAQGSTQPPLEPSQDDSTPRSNVPDRPSGRAIAGLGRWRTDYLSPFQHASIGAESLSPEKVLSHPSIIDAIEIYDGFGSVRVAESDSATFQYFLQQSGYWLDIVAPDKCFQETVPKLALENPVLYYSCLANAGNVLALRGTVSREKADSYQNKAIARFIPMIDPKSSSASTGVVSATTVLLRMTEQFQEPEEDMQCHMNGAFSVFTTCEPCWSPSRVDLPGVAFWIFVRQSIRICFLLEQGCRYDLPTIDVSDVLSPAPDEVWANRMTYLLVRLCNACWSTQRDDQSFNQNLLRLQADINAWRQALPNSFKPWYYRHLPSDPFPTIRFMSRSQVVAWQYYYGAKTMLAVYCNNDSKLSYLNMTLYLNSEILIPARLLCGVVLSCSDVGLGINGSHLLYWCGQFFSGREERSQILEWLRTFMDSTKWPNRTCIERLQALWGHGSAQGRSGETGLNGVSPPFV